MHITTIAELRPDRDVIRMPHMTDTARSIEIASIVVICRFSEVDPHEPATPPFRCPPLRTQILPTTTADPDDRRARTPDGGDGPLGILCLADGACRARSDGRRRRRPLANPSGRGPSVEPRELDREFERQQVVLVEVEPGQLLDPAQPLPQRVRVDEQLAR
jgi:hypothetical protein